MFGDNGHMNKTINLYNTSREDISTPININTSIFKNWRNQSHAQRSGYK